MCVASFCIGSSAVALHRFKRSRVVLTRKSYCVSGVAITGRSKKPEVTNLIILFFIGPPHLVEVHLVSLRSNRVSRLRERPKFQKLQTLPFFVFDWTIVSLSCRD